MFGFSILWSFSCMYIVFRSSPFAHFDDIYEQCAMLIWQPRLKIAQRERKSTLCQVSRNIFATELSCECDPTQKYPFATLATSAAPSDNSFLENLFHTLFLALFIFMYIDFFFSISAKCWYVGRLQNYSALSGFRKTLSEVSWKIQKYFIVATVHRWLCLLDWLLVVHLRLGKL